VAHMCIQVAADVHHRTSYCSATSGVRSPPPLSTAQSGAEQMLGTTVLVNSRVAASPFLQLLSLCVHPDLARHSFLPRSGQALPG
jgi:hypothetical protein